MPAIQELDPGTVEASFNDYTERLAPLNDSHPQHQGLHRHDFERALASPLVLSTEIQRVSSHVILPQLGPVGSDGWRNSGFYQKRFPDEFATHRVMHFADLPGVEPGPVVVEGLRNLAEGNGVMAIDWPSSDPEYSERVSGKLDSFGIVAEETGVVNTQTYHSIEIDLPGPHIDRKKPIDFRDAFKQLVQLGEIDPSERVSGTYIEEKIKGDEASVMSRFWTAAYDTISDHPCTQALDPDEFDKMIANPEIVKAVCRENGVAQTATLITPDLPKLTWVNADFYERLFPDKYANDQVIWFPGIATDPDPEVAGHNVPKIVDLFARLCAYGDNKFVMVFDLPDVNEGFLDAYLGDEINRHPLTSAKLSILGVQHYTSLRLRNK